MVLAHVLLILPILKIKRNFKTGQLNWRPRPARFLVRLLLIISDIMAVFYIFSLWRISTEVSRTFFKTLSVSPIIVLLFFP